MSAGAAGDDAAVDAAVVDAQGEGARELRDEARSVEVLRSDVAFDGVVWDIRREEFAYGDVTLTREFMEHPGAVAVLVIDESDRVLTIQQYGPARRRG